ncbi:hypothetical protein ILYODFUR_008988 [Ilyodon furcidens]|uniref:Uncharacterized protein n=1 Tax=Ilyodon furcidens TaxID=33524 RepID=A0ABV0UT34_9TELE
MKLHIVIMPQRGLFQGFGTQCPDRKKFCHGPLVPPSPNLNLRHHDAVGWEREQTLWQGTSTPPPVPGIRLTSESQMTTVHFRIWGRLLALISQVEVHAG